VARRTGGGPGIAAEPLHCARVSSEKRSSRTHKAYRKGLSGNPQRRAQQLDQRARRHLSVPGHAQADPGRTAAFRELAYSLAGGSLPEAWWRDSHERILPRARALTWPAGLADLETQACQIVGDEFYDRLHSPGTGLHLAHPLGVKGFAYRRVKNDERDAADLADLLRMGRLPEAWIAPPEIRELREITRYRLKLVGIRTSCKDQVHGVLAKLGVEVTCSDIFGGWGSAWLDELALPQPYAGKVASLRQLIAWVTGEIGLLDQVTAELLAGHEGYRAVQALPGIGKVLGAVIVAEIGDITRFRHPARLCSWAGLTPRHREPGTKVVRGRITKQGSRVLRWALIEAVQHVPAGTSIRQAKDAIIGRRGPKARNIAKVAAARKLLTCVFYAMRDGQARCLAARVTQQAA
jgi:transposase